MTATLNAVIALRIVLGGNIFLKLQGTHPRINTISNTVSAPYFCITVDLCPMTIGTGTTASSCFTCELRSPFDGDGLTSGARLRSFYGTLLYPVGSEVTL
ncbi:uncharacterized protein BJ212DRAFT_59384 [Suillus subaureus]|uniref:Secreted protein n=1 Tax=Suillus subaureus TaxID=48587 RepID=A0A9P7JKG1_9AGAM|nr:uncharacterized protein BJ212DRAFT_59384 [Suillus subaureus]KAG1827546.1 hypothetical protein BJ212DRAFT_59384 [Suillus subaureus]